MEKTLSPELKKRFQEYEAFHQNPLNERTHQFGIPLIVIAVLGLTAKISITPYFNLGLLLFLATVGWYWRLDRRVAAFIAIPLLMMYVVGALLLPRSLLVVAFIVGWGLQYLGHLRYEKKSPAFYQNLTHLLIGPIWIFHRTFFR